MPRCTDHVVNPFTVLTEDVKALVFDCDGTLVDTMPSHKKSWVEACTMHGISISADQFYGYAGMGTADIVSELAEQQGVNVDVESFVLDKEKCAQAHLRDDHLAPIKPMYDLFMEARKRGIKVAVASGGGDKDVIHTLKTINVYELCDAVVTRADVTKGKPDAETFKKAADLMGIAPENCIAFEDGELGLQSIEAAQFKVAYDVRYWQDYPLPESLKAKFGG